MSKPRPKVGMLVRFRKDNPKQCEGRPVSHTRTSIKYFKAMLGANRKYYRVLSVSNFGNHVLVTVNDKNGKHSTAFNWWWFVRYKKGD